MTNESGQSALSHYAYFKYNATLSHLLSAPQRRVYVSVIVMNWCMIVLALTGLLSGSLHIAFNLWNTDYDSEALFILTFLFVAFAMMFLVIVIILRLTKLEGFVKAATDQYNLEIQGNSQQATSGSYLNPSYQSSNQIDSSHISPPPDYSSLYDLPPEYKETIEP